MSINVKLRNFKDFRTLTVLSLSGQMDKKYSNKICEQISENSN